MNVYRYQRWNDISQILSVDRSQKSNHSCVTLNSLIAVFAHFAVVYWHLNLLLAYYTCQIAFYLTFHISLPFPTETTWILWVDICPGQHSSFSSASSPSQNTNLSRIPHTQGGSQPVPAHFSEGLPASEVPRLYSLKACKSHILKKLSLQWYNSRDYHDWLAMYKALCKLWL